MKTADEIIDALGGTSTVAELCDITTGAISQWRVDYATGERLSAEKGIPKPWLKFIKQMRPDLFTELAKQEVA